MMKRYGHISFFQASIAGDSDLAGPIVFAVAFGSFIMFSGKLYFNYIYGIGLLGCLAMYSLLNLMSVAGVSLTCVVSVLGYCLLPIVGLSGVSILFSLSGFLGNILTGAAVTWCALSSSKVRNDKLFHKIEGGSHAKLALNEHHLWEFRSHSSVRDLKRI